jgi:hypothetical protein
MWTTFHFSDIRFSERGQQSFDICLGEMVKKSHTSRIGREEGGKERWNVLRKHDKNPCNWLKYTAARVLHAFLIEINF